MRTHQEIDRRSLALARAVAGKIDADPARAGVEKARAVCERWARHDLQPAIREWLGILEQPWPAIRSALLDMSENGRRLRQSDPFCGILTPRERWAVYRAFQSHEKIEP